MFDRARSSPAYQAIRDGIARRRCVQPPALPEPYDWATDSDLCDVGSEVRAADRLQRAGLGARAEISAEGRHPLPVPFRAYPGTSSERDA